MVLKQYVGYKRRQNDIDDSVCYASFFGIQFSVIIPG